MGKQYIICVYKELGADVHKTFIAKSGRQVVGLMKTIMDNLNPVHVDIMYDEKNSTKE